MVAVIICSDCQRERWPRTRTAKADDCLALETKAGEARCAAITVHRLRRELAAMRALGELALERGRNPSLSNQVRLDEMCRAMALAERAKKAGR